MDDDDQDWENDDGWVRAGSDSDTTNDISDEASWWHRRTGTIASPPLKTEDPDTDEESEDADDGWSLRSLLERLCGVPKQESTEDAFQSARDRVRSFYENGEDDIHSSRLTESDYRDSLEYTIAREIIGQMYRFRSYDVGHRTNEQSGVLALIQNKIVEMHHVIGEAERMLPGLRREEADVSAQLERGELSHEEAEERMGPLREKEHDMIKALEDCDLDRAKTWEEFGEAIDQRDHILVDTFLPDGGAARQAIIKKIQSMRPEIARAVLRQALEEGAMSEETFLYLMGFVRDRRPKRRWW